ncbi:hypothetical protein ACE198_21425 [Neobacillus sp. KR4-4]|uniref:hypothetical protein n=1 Tax=Neobacillus sp. KR4-4 TaxID=3344872 RepID=UPI0035CC56FD
MEQNTFQTWRFMGEETAFKTWKEFVKGKKAALKKVLNTELYEWITNLEYVDVELDRADNHEFYDFKVSPVVKDIKGFDIPRFKKIETLMTIDLVDLKEAWPGLSEIENQTLIEMFNSYDFDDLYEHFLDIERQKQIDEWKTHMLDKQIKDILLGESGDVAFTLEDKDGEQSAFTFFIPYTIHKLRKSN